MAYNQQMQAMFIPVLEQIETSANDPFTWIVKKNMLVRDVSVVVVEATVVASSTDPVFSLDHTPAGGSRAEKATLTVAHTTVLGTEKIASVNSGVAWVPFFVEAGDTLHFEHKTAGAGGSSAGAVYYILYFDSVSDGKS